MKVIPELPHFWDAMENVERSVQMVDGKPFSGTRRDRRRHEWQRQSQSVVALEPAAGTGGFL